MTFYFANLNKIASARPFLSSILAVCSFLLGCAPKMESISARNPGMFDKLESGPMAGFSRPIGETAAPPELYVKHKEVKARPVSRSSDSGSLFNSDDERNHLFTAMPPRPGSNLVIKMASNRSPAASTPAGDKAVSKADVGKPASGNEVEESLIKALPDLAPADKSTALLSQFNTEVTHVDDNGDTHVMFRRRSVSGDQAHEIRFIARIPFSSISSGEPLSTNDLTAIEWVESSDGVVTERKSVGWEDEYSMRISGFDEIRSKSAMALEEKRKQLLDVRNRLDSRLKTFSDERNQLAKQREDLMNKDKEKDTKLAELQGTVEQQKDEIERLTPSDATEAKLGDSKDGKNGKK